MAEPPFLLPKEPQWPPFCVTAQLYQDALAHDAKLSMLFVGEAPLTVLAASPSVLLESGDGLQSVRVW